VSISSTARRLDADAVRASAHDHWSAILTTLCIPAEALRNRHGPCPGCGGKDRFRYDDRDGAGTWVCSQGGGEPLAGDGFGLLQHVHGWTFPEALREVAGTLGLGLDARLPYERRTRHRAKPRERRPREPERNSRAAASLRRVWTGSEPLDLRRHPPARRYLERRGLGAIIGDPPSGLRFHPALDYWETDDDGKLRKIGEFPALLSVVTAPSGQPVSLHRTYLTPEGTKATVSSPRKMMTPATPHALAGASIRLDSCDTTLAVAEGLETALAARVLDRSRPVWSAVNSSGLAALVIPPRVREVVILVDHDRAGMDATRKLARRLLGEGRTVRIALPSTPGDDWNDVLGHASIRNAAA